MAPSPSVTTRARGSLVRGVVLVAAVVALLAGACASDKKDETASGGDGVTDAGFVVEASDQIGPDAFTAPVDTDDGACDPQKLVEELDSRPAAKSEWARVLGIAEADVEDYIQTLEPRILEADLAVTNHGLHNNTAYSRPSLLAEGTAVLVDPNFHMSLSLADVLPPELFTTTTRMTTTTPPPNRDMGRSDRQNQPTTTEVEATTTTGEEQTTTTGEEQTTTTIPEGGQPVTRCKCGNPLLPPYAPAATGQRVAEPDLTTTTTTLATPTTGTGSTQPATPKATTTTTTEEPTSSTTPSSQPTSTTAVVTPSQPPSDEQQAPS